MEWSWTYFFHPQKFSVLNRTITHFWELFATHVTWSNAICFVHLETLDAATKKMALPSSKRNPLTIPVTKEIPILQSYLLIQHCSPNPFEIRKGRPEPIHETFQLAPKTWYYRLLPPMSSINSLLKYSWIISFNFQGRCIGEKEDLNSKFLKILNNAKKESPDSLFKAKRN